MRIVEGHSPPQEHWVTTSVLVVPARKRLQAALSRAKELWEIKKRAHITPAAPEVRAFVLAESAPFSSPPSQDCLENLLGSRQDEDIRTLPQVRGLCPEIMLISHL
jgi:hypothetical protein